MSDQPPVRRVMISSTALDLPEHRKHARDACERMSMLPLVMEQMPASPADALTLSRSFVDQADFYLGIFAFRYGFVPAGEDKSITELEYDRAVERGIPTFIFIAHEKHPVSFGDFEIGDGGPKLRALKERLKQRHVVGVFHSAEELRTEIIHALSTYRESDAAKLHYVAEIPRPPVPWVAHWYSLLGNRPLVGRREELNQLTDWVARPSSEVYGSRLLALVAIGGMGKSALAWTWFNEIAPNEMKSLAGRLWWSFYESDARLENFTARALAYLTRKPRSVTEQLPVRDREDQLLAILDREPHLVVLDGLERELVAYARMDAAHLADDDLDSKTAHTIARQAGLPDTAAQSFVGDAKLRQTVDLRTGYFLRRLTQVRAARVLVTSRLFPYELQDFNGEPLRGTSVLLLPGLSDGDALALWRSVGITGAPETLVPLFQSFEGHPLLVRTLAGEIARDRKTPGDFDGWKERYPDFDPFSLPLVQRKSHVLAYALQGLSSDDLALLRTIASFRAPAAYETLAALLVRSEKATLRSALASLLPGKRQAKQPFPREDAFDRALEELDQRGLVGWDRRGNRYDLHPIVRGVVWGRTGERSRKLIAASMRTHFESIPKVEWDRVEHLNDLTPAIELFVSLIRLSRFDEALDVFSDRLDSAMLRLGVSRQYLELVEMLFPGGVEQPPPVLPPQHGYALRLIAKGFQMSGRPGRAAACFQRAAAIREKEGPRQVPFGGKDVTLAVIYNNMSEALRVTGKLHAAEAAGLRAMRVAGQAFRAKDSPFLVDGSLTTASVSRAVRGLDDSAFARQHHPEVGQDAGSRHREKQDCALLAQFALWRSDADDALTLASRAWKLVPFYEADLINAARLQGEAALALGDLALGEEQLHYAVTHARAVNQVEEELAALVPLAVLQLRCRDIAGAREHLEAVWDAAERGPYRLLHADACNVLAAIEIAENNIPAAIAAATAAYRLVWCDGPPFAYDYGLRSARAHLSVLGVPEPEMPPYDASKHEPIEEIPIGPDEAPNTS